MIMRADNHFVGIVSIEQDTTIQPVYHIVLANNNCLIVSGSEDHEPVLAEHYNVSVNSRVNTTTVGNVAQNDGNEDPRPAPDPGPQPYTDPVPRASLAPAWRGGIRDREFSCNLLVAQPYPS